MAKQTKTYNMYELVKSITFNGKPVTVFKLNNTIMWPGFQVTWHYQSSYGNWTTAVEYYPYGATPARDMHDVINSSNNAKDIQTGWDNLSPITAERHIYAQYDSYYYITISSIHCSTTSTAGWYLKNSTINWTANNWWYFDSAQSTTTSDTVLSAREYSAEATYFKVAYIEGIRCSCNRNAEYLFSNSDNQITWTASTDYAFSSDGNRQAIETVAAGQAYSATANYVRCTITASYQNRYDIDSTSLYLVLNSTINRYTAENCGYTSEYDPGTPDASYSDPNYDVDTPAVKDVVYHVRYQTRTIKQYNVDFYSEYSQNILQHVIRSVNYGTTVNPVNYFDDPYITQAYTYSSLSSSSFIVVGPDQSGTAFYVNRSYTAYTLTISIDGANYGDFNVYRNGTRLNSGATIYYNDVLTYESFPHQNWIDWESIDLREPALLVDGNYLKITNNSDCSVSAVVKRNGVQVQTYSLDPAGSLGAIARYNYVSGAGRGNYEVIFSATQYGEAHVYNTQPTSGSLTVDGNETINFIGTDTPRTETRDLTTSSSVFIPYKLTINQPSSIYGTFTVERTSSPAGAPLGVLSTGADLYTQDVLTVTAVAAPSWEDYPSWSLVMPSFEKKTNAIQVINHNDRTVNYNIQYGRTSATGSVTAGNFYSVPLNADVSSVSATFSCLQYGSRHTYKVTPATPYTLTVDGDETITFTGRDEPESISRTLSASNSFSQVTFRLIDTESGNVVQYQYIWPADDTQPAVCTWDDFYVSSTGSYLYYNPLPKTIYSDQTTSSNASRLPKPDVYITAYNRSQGYISLDWNANFAGEDRHGYYYTSNDSTRQYLTIKSYQNEHFNIYNIPTTLYCGYVVTINGVQKESPVMEAKYLDWPTKIGS